MSKAAQVLSKTFGRAIDECDEPQFKGMSDFCWAFDTLFDIFNSKRPLYNDSEALTTLDLVLEVFESWEVGNVIDICDQYEKAALSRGGHHGALSVGAEIAQQKELMTPGTAAAAGAAAGAASGAVAGALAGPAGALAGAHAGAVAGAAAAAKSGPGKAVASALVAGSKAGGNAVGVAPQLVNKQMSVLKSDNKRQFLTRELYADLRLTCR